MVLAITEAFPLHEDLDFYSEGDFPYLLLGIFIFTLGLEWGFNLKSIIYKELN